MSKKLFPLFALTILVISLAAGCAPAATPTAAPTQAAAKPTVAPTAAPVATEKPTAAPAASGADLKVTGLVDTPVSWQEADVKAMEVITVEATNKSGVKSSYDGVLISSLLKKASPKADAKTLVFVASDGFTAETTLASIMDCKDCILSFRSNGGFSSVLPGQASNLQVKGVVELQVK